MPSSERVPLAFDLLPPVVLCKVSSDLVRVLTVPRLQVSLSRVHPVRLHLPLAPTLVHRPDPVPPMATAFSSSSSPVRPVQVRYDLLARHRPVVPVSQALPAFLSAQQPQAEVLVRPLAALPLAPVPHPR